MSRLSLKGRRMKKYQWLIVLMLTVFAAMYVYGMSNHYFPEPVPLGGGQYIDIATGVIIISLLFAGFVIGILFKKKKRGRRG